MLPDLPSLSMLLHAIISPLYQKILYEECGHALSRKFISESQIVAELLQFSIVLLESRSLEGNNYIYEFLLVGYPLGFICKHSLSEIIMQLWARQTTNKFSR